MNCASAFLDSYHVKCELLCRGQDNAASPKSAPTSKDMTVVNESQTSDDHSQQSSQKPDDARSGDVKDEVVQRLLKMGFSKSDALAAAERSHGRISTAVSWCKRTKPERKSELKKQMGIDDDGATDLSKVISSSEAA